MKNLATMRDYPFIADGYLEYHLQKCRDCQYDRMICAINPMCARRYFLTLLIKNGVQPGDEDLPAFCYSQHISNLQRYIAGKRTLYPPFDSIIFLDDFFKLILPKDYRKLNRLLDKENLRGFKDALNEVMRRERIIISWTGTRFAVLIPPGDFLGPEDNIFFLDLDHRYVIIDPRREEIFFKRELKTLLKAFGEAYQISITFLDRKTVEGAKVEEDEPLEVDARRWYLDFFLGTLAGEAQVEPLNIKFMEMIEDFTLSASEVRLLIDDDSPGTAREVHVVINLAMEKGKFSIEKERITFDKVKKLVLSCVTLQNFITPKGD